jgi:hypothetical protein
MGKMSMSKIKSFAVLALSVIGLVAQAAPTAPLSRQDTIKQTFAQLNGTSKGALGKNVYQRPNGRTQVITGDGTIQGPPGDTIFTVAFRNDVAASLTALDFYVGNRFASNYWELHNKYLATPADQRALAFHIDHARFLATPQMADEARSRARHMLLEQFYMRKFPQSAVTRANVQRGTADADNEARFYGMLVEYLAKQAASQQDYVNVFEVQRRWNLTGDIKTVSLASLRDTVASIYDQLTANYGDTQMTYDFRIIRNSVHNYMTPGVLDLLNKFLANYSGQMWNGEESEISSLRDKIRLYYKTDKGVLKTWVAKNTAILPADAATIVNALADGTNSLAQLETLSGLMTRSLDSFWANRNPDVIHFLIRANQFLQVQLAARPLTQAEDWNARMRIAISAAYATGELTADAYDTAMAPLAAPQAANAGYMRARLTDINNLFVIAQANVQKTMMPALADWANIDSSMEGFVDDTLRGSMLTELDQISTFLKKQLPNQGNVPYEIYFQGDAFGYLTYVPKGATDAAISKLDKTQIPIFADLPLDLGVVSAIITEQQQTPLSHVSIKSKSRGTPDAYYPNASQDPMFKDLLAKHALVKVSFKDGKITIRPATIDEATAAWQKMKAPSTVDVKGDLTETRIRSTKELHSSDVITVGAKAANYGELELAIGDDVVREGLGIPFFYYKQFVDQNRWDDQTTLSQHIHAMLADPRMQTDRDYLLAQLKALQTRMTADDMVVDSRLVNELALKLNQLYPGQAVRFRSSSNSEDLPNFSGAGLYDSNSFDPKSPKKTIEKTLKKTWSSVWNSRAFDEREIFSIRHEGVYMGILCSPSFGTELANGVAISRNTVYPKLGLGVYINTQKGEDLVTNPDPDFTPEELVVLTQPDVAAKLPYTLRYVKYSKRNNGAPLMSNDEVVYLTGLLQKINAHFRPIFDPKMKNPTFAMDVEFKVSDMNGKRQIFLKQARPYIAH